ncbi:MAG: Di-/tripeptide transporter [Chlamydiae bacterium]|nr:Di-/tripeptide transporter [Chlamydiota bacterium]
MLFRHSKGLSLLFTTEMWERFSFYAMRALLVLYMTTRIFDGGLGWSRAEALRLYGIYLGAAYLTPVIGGYLSDRFLGQRRSAMIGAVMMAVGHFCMAFNELWLFYSALALIALGNGFFKPCLTSILGQLYDDADESQRDSAYSLFYMGINIGGAAAGLVSGWLLVLYGFDVGFAAAGVGMVIATLIFWWGKGKYLGDAGLRPTVKVKDHHAVSLTHEEKKQLLVVGFLFIVTVFFIVAWEQVGGLITLFIDESVDRQFGSWVIPTPWLANVDPFFIVFLAPTLSVFWAYLGKRKRDPFIGAKMGLGCLFLALSFVVLNVMSSFADEGIQSHWGWVFFNKLLVVLGELCVIPISWAAATKLSPKGYISRVMGVMLAGIGIGSYLAGIVGSYVDEVGATTIFRALTIELVVLAGLCFLVNGKLKKLAHVEDYTHRL